MLPTLTLAALLVTSPAPTADLQPTFMSLKGSDAVVADLSALPSFGVELPTGDFAQAYARTIQTEPSWDGQTVTRWIGHLSGFPDSDVALTQKEGYTVGRIRVGRDSWYLSPNGELMKIDFSQSLPCGTTHRSNLKPEHLAQSDHISSSEPSTVSQTSFIDVLAVYDSTFEQVTGGRIQAEVQIEDAIARASQAVRNSRAGLPYRLVGIVKLSQDIPPREPFTVMFGSEVKALRDQYGADLVQGYALHFYTSQGIGVGGLSSGYHDGADTGYASVVSHSAVHLHTPAHEFGHNSGADHEAETALRPAPARPFGYCPPNGADGWGTIMWSGSTPLPGRCTGQIIDYFSNPHIPYHLGIRLGVPGKIDNALVMRSTAAKLSNFRPSKVTNSGTCTPSEDALCLNGGRFQVTAHWRTHQQAGYAKAVRLTEDTGYLWFFDPKNVEVVVKVLNGCPLNNHFWVFAGGLTDVGVVLTVTDTKTGFIQQYTNGAGYKFQPIQDTVAFPTCP